MKTKLLAMLALMLTAWPASADASTCHRDSGGHLICRSRGSNGQRCSTTCHIDSGGHQVCKTICR